MSTEKFAIVTGSSSGLGLAMSEQLLEEGFVVFGVSRSGSSIIHQNYIDLIADIRDESAVEEMYGEIEKVTDKIHLLVNNAGMMSIGPISETSSSEFQTILETNVLGTFHILKFFEEFIIEHQTHVVNILSMGAKEPIPNFAAFCSSKFGQRGLLESVKQEWARYGVRFTSLYPGAVATPLWTRMDIEESPSSMLRVEDFLKVFSQAVNSPIGVQYPDITFYAREGFVI